MSDELLRVIVARYVTTDEASEKVRATLLRMGDIVRKDEPGCRTYRTYRSVADPNVFVLYEEYEDQQALEDHRGSPHFRQLIEGTIVPMLTSRERDIVVPLDLV